MLSGEEGECYRRAMEILVKMGDFVRAKRMVPVNWADLTKFSGMWGGHGDTPNDDMKKYIEGFINICLEEGAKFKCPLTITDATGTEKDQKMKKLGAQLISGVGASTPHDLFPWPLFGQHIAAGATNGNTFFNGALGARGNNEGPAGVFMAALTGVTPEYDLHLPENRLGKVLVDVKVRPKNYVDWAVIGFYISLKLSTHWWDVPVLTGINPDIVTSDDIIAFCASMNNPGSMTMWLMERISPEAHTLDQAFGGEKPKEKFVVGKEEPQEIYDMFPITGNTPEAVEVRFPLTVDRLYKVAEMVRGKKVHKNVKCFSVDLTLDAKAVGEAYGSIKILRDAGIYVGETQGQILWNGKVIDPWRHAKREGIKTIVTDSPKNCYGMGNQDIDVVLMPSLEKCVQVALTGSMEV